MTIEKSKIFLCFCLSFVAGVGIGRYVNYYVMATCAVIFFILISVWWEKFPMRVIGFAGLVLLLGTLRYQTSFLDNRSDFVGKDYGQEITIEGVVVREPDVRSDKLNLTVSPSARSGNILLNLGRYPEYQYGDHLKISGKLEQPFVSEEFSYKDYLSRYDTYAVMRFPKVERLAEGEGNVVKSIMLAVKRKFQETLSGILPEPHNALAQGMILGAKRALPEGLKNALIAVGVSHIIVISGYNMSIITSSVLRTRPWLGRRVALILSVLIILGFVVMTGADASVVRAAVMALLVVLALNLGRIYVSLNALVFVAAVMIFENPKILAFDVGFQLSFMATAGLIYLGSWFEQRLQFIPNVLEFRKNLSSTLAAQVFALPLLVYYFDRLSLVSVLVNVIILWAVPYAMLLTLVSGIAGLIFLPAGQIIGTVLWGILEYQIWIVRLFAGFPFAEVAVSVPFMVVIIYYVLLFWRVWRLPRKNLLIFSHDREQIKI